MWVTSMGNHGAAGVSQNAGVLVIIIIFFVATIIIVIVIV